MKKLNILRFISLILTMVLSLLFIKRYGIFTKNIFIYISLIILLIISIGDIKLKLKTSLKYNLLFISIMLLTSFLLARSLFDTSLISNSKTHLEILNNLVITNNISDSYKYISLYYFEQNIYLLLFLYFLIILYHRIENNKLIKERSKYSLSSILCLILNILFSIRTLDLIYEIFNINHFPLLFFVINVILLIVEIVSLVKNNGLKREWPIYLSFVFNLFAFISIFT